MFSLDLRYNHLTEVPAEIGNLEALTSLKLDNNRISGFSYLDEDGNEQSGNDEGDAIPPSFGNLSAEDNINPFTLLSLYNNDLSGKIPSALGELENIKTLRLHNNALDSEIPAELLDLDKLIVLNLENNLLEMKAEDDDQNSIESEAESLQWFFTGRNKIKEISNRFTAPSIRFLYLEENKLESLPEDFGNNLGQNMQELTLYKNNLTELPESIENLDDGDGDIESLLSEKDQNLTYLDLGSNQLKNFPGDENQKKITVFDNLKYLNLSRQTEFTEANDLQGNMAGPVPKELTDLSSLETLFLNNNQLESLPTENWNNMSKLIYFYAQNNNIDNLPANMGNLASLERLYLNNNQIDAAIPNKITETGNLLRVYLQYNLLSGALPVTDSWNSLERFFADENQLEGGITQDFVTGLSSLNYFSINNNTLDGTITPSINEMRSLRWWDIAQNNELYGMLPSSVGDISNLEMLDFNNDKITEIPDSINNLTNLHTIFGFENEVTNFAEEIGNMSSLERFDFHNVEGGNHIGTFPAGVENLNNLIYFSFGENETVGGEVPWEEWLGNYPQDALFLNNNYLTGSFADGMLAETKDMVFFNARNNNFNGEIPES
jgi:Leucine-rich repeat (LRR) protein